jgi:arginine decarboxylase
MHTSTSPQYSIIASCDVAAAMMEAPGGTALVEEHPGSAGLPPRHEEDRPEWGKDWWFKVWGPDELRRRRHRLARRLDHQGRGRLARFRQPGTGLQHAGPDQGHHRQPGPVAGRQVRRDRHPGVHRDQVPGRARRDRREVRPVLVLHHVHHRHHQGPLEHAADRAAAVQGRLRQEPADVAHPAGVRPANPRYERMGLRDLCQQIHEPTRPTTWPA